MSFDTSWDIEKYKEDHESGEHWQLRKTFMERWKDNYPEERLVCLARVFANIEFMGCRYPIEVMKEVATLSKEVAQQYRKSKTTKLQRTFVSASDAAEDRARGVKREGGIIKDASAAKSTKINFVPQGHSTTTNEEVVSANEKVVNISDNESNHSDDTSLKTKTVDENVSQKIGSGIIDPDDFVKEMSQIKCVDSKMFTDLMFNTVYGRLVLFIRPWSGKLCNILNSCQACHVNAVGCFKDNSFSITINGNLVAEATGATKAEAKLNAGKLAWNKLREEAISILVKEQWIAQGDRVSMNDVSKRKEEFGTPIENSVATKMMKLMGWKGGGLGADAQGIEEPIKPHLQMVNRAGLGSDTADIHQIRRAGHELMRRFIASASLDVDLVFSSEFSKDERATLHQCARRAGLATRSYGVDEERFLVVKKKLKDPFSLVRAVVENGGETPKYRVFIPAKLAHR